MSTTQKDVDAILIEAVDTLVEVRWVSGAFGDDALFGGPTGFDAALTKAQTLVAALLRAKDGYA